MLEGLHQRLPPRVGRPATAAVLERLGRRDRWRSERRAHRLAGGYARGEVAVRRMGFDWVLDLADGASRVLYYVGAYEQPLVSLLTARVQPGDVVLDVGAHVGIHTLPLAAAVGPTGRVIAVEAAEDTAARLHGHLVANGLEERVTIVRTALLDVERDVTLQGDRRLGDADNSVRSLYGEGAVTARTRATTFDAWARADGLDRLDVVKMDIEGAEALALDGMTRTLETLRPRLVVVEEKDELLARAGVGRDAVRQRLGALGYVAGPALSALVTDQVVTAHDDATIVYAPGDAGTSGS